MRPLLALLLPPGPQILDHLAAALDGGPAILPLDPHASPAARDRLLDRLRPHAVVDADDLHPRGDPAPLDDDVAVVVATSGSAGTPKGVQLSAAALRYSARATLDRLGVHPGERWLCCLPTHHIAGLQVLVRSLVGGTTPEIHERFDPTAVAASDAAYISVVPTMLHRALEAGADWSRFRRVLVGGANAPLALHRRAAEAGIRHTTTYGMTETSGGCVYDDLPLDGVELTVVDDRIRIRGPVLANGYRLDPAATAAAFVDGWHLTPDAGELAPKGRVVVLGRLDDVVVSGGINVSLVQVAAALCAHRAVAEAAAYAVPDAEWGQRIVAVVVPENEPPTLAELRRFVAEAIAPAAAPRVLVLTDALPTLPGGKLDRRALATLTA